MRRAELVVAMLFAAFSIYLMWKSSELEIRYVSGEGPGGGFWPFWLAAGMLICTGLIMLRWVRRASPPSQSDLPIVDSHGVRMLVLVGGGLIGFVALCQVLGMYGGMFVFLIYYLRFLGKHGWPATLAIAIATPVTFFFFFDVAMRQVLPKGYLEPLFLPLYAIFL